VGEPNRKMSHMKTKYKVDREREEEEGKGQL